MLEGPPIRQTIEWLHKAGVLPKINVLIGACPHQTKDDIKRQFEVLNEMKETKYITYGIVIPHPETEYYQDVKKNGWFITKTKDYVPADPLEAGTFSTPAMSAEDMQEMVRWCYKKTYWNPKFITNLLIHTKSLKELKENMKTGYNLVFRKQNFNEE